MDTNKGYWQLPLIEESSFLTAMNTPYGRNRFTRMPYGILSAQEVFHKRIYQHFMDIQVVVTDIDDFLVWGTNIEDRDRSLIACLEKAQKI